MNILPDFHRTIKPHSGHSIIGLSTATNYFSFTKAKKKISGDNWSAPKAE